MSTRRRGQSLAEFALVVTIMVAALVTAIDFVPLFNIRAQVFEVAASATEAAARYRAPIGKLNSPISEPTQRAWLCEQLSHQVYETLLSLGLDVGTTTPKSTCDPTDFSTLGPDRRFTVSAQLLASFDAKPGDAIPAEQNRWDIDPRADAAGGNPTPRYARICVGYQWQSKMGLLALYNRGIADFNAGWFTAANFGFCGRAVLDPRRSR